MEHLHNIIDSDNRFVINPITRVIKNESGKVTLVQNDHNSERFTFEIHRYVDGHDMSLCDKIEIHYINLASATEKSEDVYLVDDLTVDEWAEDKVIFSWLISANATKYAGTLNFLIRFVCLDGETVAYAWNTAIFKGITVGDGMNNSASVIEQSSDVLEAWKSEVLGEAEAAATRAEEAAARAEAAGGTSEEVERRLAALESSVSDLNYKEITIGSFLASPSSAEMGSTVNSVALSWGVSKAPKALTLDGTALDVGATSKTVTGTFTANKTWTLKATDERDAVATRTATLSFLNGVYYGVSTDAGIAASDSDAIRALTKSLRGSKLTSFNVTAGAGQYIYYCLPKRMGTCSFKVGGFDGGFSLVSEGSFTNASGYAEDYYIYRSDNASLGATTVTVT